MHASTSQLNRPQRIYTAIGHGLLITVLLIAPMLSYADEPAPDQSDQQVVISGTRDPALMSYRVMLAGLDAFDEYHNLAPAAQQVQFRLKAHSKQADDLHDLTLKIAGDSVTIPVPLTADAEFTLPRSSVAEDEDADMMLSKNKQDYSLDIEIHSDGLPANTRRLGDLRLECEVAIAIAKKEIGFFWKATINTLLLTSDWCMSDKVNIPSYMKQQIDSATLLNGNERIALKIDPDHHSFEAPINNRAYSDNDLIELQFGSTTASK